MRNKILLTILSTIISIFIVIFATAGAMYLVGNLMNGWAWMTFDICFAFSGILMLIAFMIVMIVLKKKEDN